MELSVRNAEETIKYAQLLSRVLMPGDIILLNGDLGAGKTTFTKGLAVGLGITKNVKSPTFNLVKEYHDGRLPLFHMDLYRLEGIGAGDLGLEEYFNQAGVSVLEWSKFVIEDIPTDHLVINLVKNDEHEDWRKIELMACGQHYERLLSKFAELVN
ncbi:tRNA (adenosine(37)-N6)-threonylcarbamoyltransferase complex ATPase subunit type 1 TsaE [Liquorilactobacillus mali]|uniref:tRNA threonylcarbamoyladenosine biosynthesis protein TsaE n=1 Tax=Liquorilactobacillus mali TaxID=1618 RepID=A0A0R2FTU3_9LACO|nr:tRNA (adenosine(37)-N6)-threonylcarbamoyltransferase complex ATPase subunit type 1 TsaE [Liquorilactobacillus mali]KRN31067.1 ATP GTP hydrolase [Liquorilactobacillus mali]MDN7145836.1 tRNA (adenosine(37)-N6)-threonylcarbamoyltransferase complex ATPase subunit type 1 TsaE [Liquorilactobacillus mali]